MVGVLKRQVPSCGDLGGSSYDLVEDNTAIPAAKETGFVRAFCKDPWVEGNRWQRASGHWPVPLAVLKGLPHSRKSVKEGEPPADSGGTGTHRQLLLAIVGGTMSMSYMARAPWAAPMLAGLRPTGW